MLQVGWHTFRHTHATLLNGLGESVKTAQVILGHAYLQTTLQVYPHAVPASMGQAEDRPARKLMDPNGPKLKDDAVPNPEQGVWIQ